MAPGPDVGPSRIDDTTAGNTPLLVGPILPRHPGPVESGLSSVPSTPGGVRAGSGSPGVLVGRACRDPARCNSRWSSLSRPRRLPRWSSLSRPRRCSVVEPVETTRDPRWSSLSRPRSPSVVEPVETTQPIGGRACRDHADPRWSSLSSEPTVGEPVETTRPIGGRACRDHATHSVVEPVEPRRCSVVEPVETTPPTRWSSLPRPPRRHSVVEPVETTPPLGGRACRDHARSSVVEPVETTTSPRWSSLSRPRRPSGG